MPQSIITNAVVATGGRVVNGLAGLVVTALLARLLGVVDFGSYILLLSYGALVQLAADGGLYLTLSRRIAERSRQPAEVANILVLRLALLATMFLLGLALAAAIPSLNSLISIFAVIALGLVAQSVSQLLLAIFQHQQEVWRATVGDLAGRAAQLAVIFFIWHFSLGLLAVAFSFALGTIVQVFINWRLVPRNYRLSRPQLSWKVTLEIIKESWPVAALLMVNAVYFRVDTLILSIFRDPTEVGFYGLAYRVVEAALFFPAMLGGLLLPRLSESLSHNQEEKASSYVSEGFSLLGAAAIIVLVLLAGFSDVAVQVIGGSSFALAAPLLKILGLALAAMFLGNLFGFTLIALKQQKKLLGVYVFLMVLNLTLNLMLVPQYGAPAAAWTTVITESLAALIAGYLVWKKLPFNPWRWRLGLLVKK